MEKIIISKDFTDAPGARYRSDGNKSGQEFYEDILSKKFQKALEANEKLYIDMDDTFGYPSSFLSESFGKLQHDNKGLNIWDKLDIKSEDDDTLLDLIKEMAAEYE